MPINNLKKNVMERIVITKVPLKYFYYFQYLIYGFRTLDKTGIITFKIKYSSFFDVFFQRFYLLYKVLFKFSKYFRSKIPNYYLMEGYFEKDGKRVYFCYDIADSPHYYNTELLESVDLYFKAQHPIEFKEIGFELTSNAILSFPSEIFKSINKIKPSMLGPGFNINNLFAKYSTFDEAYKRMLIPNIVKTNSIMCYFGNSLGPKEVFSNNPDLFNNESNILSYFKNLITHPNLKRSIASKKITEFVLDSDARVVHDGNCDEGFRSRSSSLYISLQDFPLHISKFKYNLNISGHRLSIPYRFINSFIVGTAIVTDKLKVKWYLPFGPEVFETVEMGYLPVETVEWTKFKEDIMNLPEVSVDDVLNAFNTKWSPMAFANYIVNTCKTKI